MKNITLSVDERVLRAARRYAAEHDSSVNALVRDYLEQIAARADRAATARARLRELSEKSEARQGTARWSRDDLHERG